TGGQFSTGTGQGHGTGTGTHSAGVAGASKLTTGPAPSCVSIPAGSLPPRAGAGGSTSCAHSPAPVDRLPASAQPGTRTSKSGVKVNTNCPGSPEKGGHVTPGGTGSTTHGNV